MLSKLWLATGSTTPAAAGRPGAGPQPAKLERARASVLKAAVEGRLVPTEAELAKAEGRTYEPAAELLERILAERKRQHDEAQVGAKRKKQYKPPVEPDTEGLPELPEGWVWATADRLVQEGLCNGRSVKTREGGFPVLRLTALDGGWLRLAERKEGDWDHAAAEPYLVQQGDFFIARGNSSIDRVGAGALLLDAPDLVAFPDTMIRLRFSRLLHPPYAAWCWQSPLLRKQIQASARTTAGIYKVNQRSVSSYKVPLPPKAEQERIVAEVERRLSVLDAADQAVERNLIRCGNLRQPILKRAFEGKLVPQDRSDEPASALLARVAQESAQRA